MLKDYLLEYKTLAGVTEEGPQIALSPEIAHHYSTMAYAHHAAAKKSGEDADIVRAIKAHVRASNAFSSLAKQAHGTGDIDAASAHEGMAADHGMAADGLADFSNDAHLAAFKDEAASELVPV